VLRLLAAAGLLSLLATLYAGDGISGDARAQTPFKVRAALVEVPVVVTDPQGGLVVGLKREDFTVLDDGVPREISLFEASHEPLRIALILDTSKSTVTVLDDIRKAARKFLDRMKPEDEAMVMTFDSEVRLRRRLTSDRDNLLEAVSEIRPGEYVGSRLRDAVYDAAVRRFESVAGRKAILLLSDGQDYGSEVAEAEFKGAMAASNTVVYSVLYQIDPREVMQKLFGVKSRTPGGDRGLNPAWRGREKEAEDLMRGLAVSSGGGFYPVKMSDLNKVFAAIERDLRQQYWLGFQPDASRQDGATHAIQVKINRAGTTIRHRPSYRIQ
jgi:VWFA-related protein